jgi:hypothetical protein
VSIPSAYRPASKALIVEFLSRGDRRSPYSTELRSRNPWDDPAADLRIRRLASDIRDADELNAVIADLEPDGKGLPILLRQYLRLGAQALAFGVDPDFGDCLDCLVLFDVATARERILCKYMGKDYATRYLLHRRESQRQGARPSEHPAVA